VKPVAWERSVNGVTGACAKCSYMGIVNWVKHKDDKLSLWIKSLQKRMTPNKVNVAVANKLARIAWAVMTYQVEYRAK